jgi:hypothetical protein
MALYALTKIQDDSGIVKYSFTGAAAATALADQTGYFDIPSDASEIIATYQVVKAGTTDTATATLQGTLDGGTTVVPFAAGTSTTNVVTNTTGTTAVTSTVVLNAQVGGNTTYKTPKFPQGRISFTTSGTTDNKNIINGTIVIKKNLI